jgi:ArsR family transcriptional regulator
MQLVEPPAHPEEATVAVGPSIAVELSWVLLAAGREQLRAARPSLAALYETPGTESRVRSFWDDGVADFGEELVLADEAGALAELEVDSLLSAIAEAAARGTGELRLASEEPSDRAVFLLRLERLRRSARLRREYLALLAHLWGGVGPSWEGEGRRLVEVAAQRYRRRIERGTSWEEAVIADSEHLAAHLPGLIEKVGPVSSVTIAPSYFSGQGLLFDLPNGILVGVRAMGTDAGTRARTDGVARRLKALADPTRLAIAHRLGEGAMTVGEIARAFALAQPTVSNHVKILREAGILTGSRRGTKVALSLHQEAVDEVVGDLHDLLSSPETPGRPAG